MAEKEYDEDDPMELVGVRLTGPEAEAALDEMARVFVEEFLRMGCTKEQILAIFRNPFYRGPHAVRERRGDAFVVELIDGVA